MHSWKSCTTFRKLQKTYGNNTLLISVDVLVYLCEQKRVQNGIFLAEPHDLITTTILMADITNTEVAEEPTTKEVAPSTTGPKPVEFAVLVENHNLVTFGAIATQIGRYTHPPTHPLNHIGN